MKITRLAPAKINLMLHVVGRLPDGYHHLQFLAAFADAGDLISVESAEASRLEMDGPFASLLPLSGDNSVIRAAQWLKKRFPEMGQAQIHLTKNLPVAAGIGGGTSDAAATIPALLELNNIALTEPERDQLIVASGELGADVPLCLAHQFERGPYLWVDGSGREAVPISIQGKLPGIMLLVNPLVPVSTLAIFKQMQPPYTPFQDFQSLLKNEFQGDLLTYLKHQKNDLTELAMSQVESIRTIIDTLNAQDGCLLARMSGSGGTCFGLFEDEGSAQAARSVFDQKVPLGWSSISSLC